MITIYCLDISEISIEIYKKFYLLVSKERKLNADKFHFMDDSIRCVFGEILLQYSLFQFLGYAPKFCIDYNQYGKAFIRNLNGFLYNISHSGRWVAFAYGSDEVGVDVEKISYDYDIEDLVNTFFPYEDKQFIHSNSDKISRAKRFTQIWTLKESYIKYLGTGLFTSLNSFSIDISDGVVRNSNNKIDEYAKLKSYLLDNDYYLSVCSQDDNSVIKVVTINELLAFYHSSFV